MSAPEAQSAKAILLADDDEAMLKVLERRLTSWGYRVCFARDGEETLRVAKAERPLLILLDVMMPRMDGLEACRRLTRDPATSGIPVILLSAKASQISGEEVREAGALTAVQKPYEPEELLRLIRESLGSSPGNS
jgi:CheY-like chemotaxis protein